jgi:hypothetical protein
VVPDTDNNGKFGRAVAEHMGETKARLAEGEARMDRMEAAAERVAAKVDEVVMQSAATRVTLARWGGGLAALILLARFGSTVAEWFSH